MDLVDFLRARLDEDQEVARSAIAGPWAIAENGELYAPFFDREIRYGAGWSSVDHLYVTSDSEGLLPSVQEEQATHIARHDPARVLADVEAKRRIIELHRVIVDSAWPAGHCLECWDQEAGDYRPWPCSTLQLLALPFAEHPDYRQEWKP